MTSFFEMAHAISALGFDVYICKAPQKTILFVNPQTHRIYVCFYEPFINSTNKGLFGFGVIHLDTETRQPCYIGAEYGHFNSKNGTLTSSELTAFLKTMISDLENDYRKETFLKLFKASELSEKYIAKISFKFGFKYQYKI